MKKIENVSELIEYLTRLCSAYRKSYKLCGNVDTVLMVVTGIISSTAVLAMVPAVPVFVAAVGAVPVVTGVISGKLRLEEKKARYKNLHKNYKQLLSYCQTVKDDAEVVPTVFAKITEIQKSESFTEPLERYVKAYHLNGYENNPCEQKLLS